MTARTVYVSLLLLLNVAICYKMGCLEDSSPWGATSCGLVNIYPLL